VNAYWARTETMDGAELVASINRALCEQVPEIGQGFLMLVQCMSAALAESRLCAKVSGVEVMPAPQHERAGHA
jgi:hypothetical protein